MLFFDSKQSNIDEVGKLGVVTVLVKNGMTMKVIMDGLEKYSKIKSPQQV